MFFFFFKQKTAYEMRISDWSSGRVLFRSHDMSSMAGSAMAGGSMAGMDHGAGGMQEHPASETGNPLVDMQTMAPAPRLDDPGIGLRDRKSVVSGQSVSVRVDLGGRRIIQKKKSRQQDRERKRGKTRK